MSDASVKILKDARELIHDPENWTQSAYARNKRGTVVSFEANNAVCFCAMGALFRVSPPDETGTVFKFLRGASKECGSLSPSNFNDHHSHEEVLALFDKAISLAEVAS